MVLDLLTSPGIRKWSFVTSHWEPYLGQVPNMAMHEHSGV